MTGSTGDSDAVNGPLDGGSPLFQCNETAATPLDGGSPLFQCNETAAAPLDSGSPQLQCNETAAAPLDGGSPLFQCNETAAAPLDGGSPLFQCNGAVPPDIGPPPGGSGARWVIGGVVGASAVVAALFFGGVFDGGNTPQPTGLDGQANSLVAPTASPTESSAAPSTPAAAVVPTSSTSPTPKATTTSRPTATSAPATTAPAVVIKPTATPTATTAAAPKPTATATRPPPAPTMGKLSANPSAIYESYPKGSKCTYATTSTVSVTVTDPAGISSVTLSWTVNGASGSTKMTPTGPSSYQAVIGPYTQGTVGKSGGTIALSAKAVDKGGRSASSASTVFLYSSSGC